MLDCWMLSDDDNQISSAQISHGSWQHHILLTTPLHFSLHMRRRFLLFTFVSVSSSEEHMDKSSCGGILIQYAGVLGEAFLLWASPFLATTMCLSLDLCRETWRRVKKNEEGWGRVWRSVMTMCPVQTLCIYGDTRRSLDTLWMAEWLQPPLYLPRKELFSELCLEIILKCSQRLQLALAGAGSVIVMIFIYQISDIKPLLQDECWCQWTVRTHRWRAATGDNAGHGEMCLDVTQAPPPLATAAAQQTNKHVCNIYIMCSV